MQPRVEHGMNTLADLIHAAPESILKEHNDVLRIVDKIRDYDPNLDVAYLDPDKGSIADAPYAVFEWCPDGVPRLVLSVWELNDSVMDRIIAADTTKFDVQGAIDLNNARVRKEIEDRKKERMGEAKDIVKHVVDSPKGTYSFPSTTGETVTLRDDEGIVKRDGKSVT